MVKKIGRNRRSIPEGKTQVNFNALDTVIGKMRSIARKHEYTNADVYNQALEKFVELYEAKHGPVEVEKNDIV